MEEEAVVVVVVMAVGSGGGDAGERWRLDAVAKLQPGQRVPTPVSLDTVQ